MKNRTRTEYSVINIFTGIVGYSINTIVGFICRVVFTRCLSQEYLGVNGLFSNVLSILSLAELGIGTAIVYALYKPLAENDTEKIKTLTRFYRSAYMVIGAVISVLGVCFIPFLNVIVGETNISEDMRFIYLFYLFNTAVSYFFSYRISLLMASQRNYIVTGLNYIATITQSLVQILLLFTTKSFILYLVTQIVFTMIYNIAITICANKIFPFLKDKKCQPLSKDEKKSLVTNIKALIATKFGGVAVNNVDNILVTFFSGLATTGVTSNYILFQSTLNSVLQQIFNNITASVGNFNTQEDDKRKKELFSFLNLMNFWLFGLGAIGIVFVSSDLVQLFFGEEYVLPINIPILLAINFYMVGMQSAVWAYRNTMGLFVHGRYLLFLTATINLILSIWFGNMWGIEGIYLATIFSRLFTNTWYDPYVVYKYGLKSSPFEYLKKYIVYIVAMLCSGVICVLIVQFINFNIYINLVLKFLMCIIVTNVVFYIFFSRTDEFKYCKKIVGSILKKLQLKIKHK